MSFVDVMSFVGGAADRAREYDKVETERAQRLAEIKSKRQDELLKTRWSEAKKKRDKDVERYEGFIDKGGDITSLQTQSYLLGYDDVASMQKDIVKTKQAGGTFSWADAPVMPPELEAIKYSDEDAIYKSLLKTQGTTAGQIFEALGGSEREKKEVELTDEQLGSVSTYRRATPTPLTEEQKTTLSGYKFEAEPEDEKEWQFKFRKHTENKERIIELYKGKENTDEAKQAFAQVAQDERTLIYGKDGSTSDWQRRFNLHVKDAPKREEYVSDAQYTSAMKTWQHGYNILKLGAGYDKNAAAKGKPQVVSVFNSEGNQVKVLYTGKDTDTFGGTPGWKQFGGVKKEEVSATGPVIKEIFINGERQKIEYTGNDKDTAGGSPGWRFIGGTKQTADTAKGPKVGDMMEVYVKGDTGQKQKLYYTGSVNDYYDGMQGWSTIGGVSSMPEEAFSEKKWNSIKKPIYDAIRNKEKINPEDWRVYKLNVLENKDALSQYIADEMAELDNLAKTGLEYPELLITVKGANIPATLENMRTLADTNKKGLSLEQIRDWLYKRSKEEAKTSSEMYQDFDDVPSAF